MGAKIDDVLLEQVRAAEASDPDKEIPVIVTIRPGAAVEGLSLQGLVVKRVFNAIPALSGVIAARAVHALQDLDEVERVEYDGNIHAA